MTRLFTIHSVGNPVPMERDHWQSLPEPPAVYPVLAPDERRYYRCVSCPRPAVVSITRTRFGLRVLRHPVDQQGEWGAAASPAVAVA